jgi:hypothetical protein
MLQRRSTCGKQPRGDQRETAEDNAAQRILHIRSSLQSYNRLESLEWCHSAMVSADTRDGGTMDSAGACVTGNGGLGTAHVSA